MSEAILLSDRQAAALFGMSRATLWRRVRDKSLPQPVRLHGLTRWRRDELLAAIDALSAERCEPEAA